MSTDVLTTDSVQTKDRLPYWCDLVCHTFVELECDSEQTDHFSGEMRNVFIGDIQITSVNSVAQKVRRTRSRISSSNNDHFLISLQTVGKGVVSQDGRSAILSPGDFALYDTTRPYDLIFDDAFSQIVLSLRRETVTSRLIDSDLLTARRIDGRRGVGLLASKFIRQLHQQIGEFDELSAGRLHGSAVELLATALAEQVGAHNVASESQVILRQRVCAYVDANLSNHDLTCDSIAAAHGVSPRQLRKVFESSPLTLSEWIWSRRLNQAKRDLVDPLLAHLSVTAIAYDVGFKDSAHFSRAFRARFEMSPREWRNRGMWRAKVQ